jgi:homospermidine synthase
MPAELGWGTHEKWVPENGRFHDYGCKAAIYLTSSGMSSTVKSWCPTFGSHLGYLVTHDESISIADYYTVREDDKVVYRPTSHYAYHPCPDAVASTFEALGAGNL